MAVDPEPILDHFRQWLLDAREAGERLAQEPAESEPPEVGLSRLAEEFTALRQEVKLQARGARSLEEESARLLTGLQQALEALKTIEPREEQAAFSAGKNLALVLAGLDEALDRSLQQFDKGGSRLVEAPDAALLSAVHAVFARQPWWRRLVCGGLHREVRQELEQRLSQSPRPALFAALREGYALLQQRVARSLADEGVSRIPAIGRRVDPEQMVVLELVDAPAPPGTVVDEVRRGYLWNGRLLRAAEVRATRLSESPTTA